MRIKITGGGIFDGKGQEVEIGKEFDIANPELNEDGSEVAPHPWAGRFEVISGGTETKAKGGKKGVTNPAPAKYEARAKGDVFVIVDGDGKEYGAALTEADAKDFNALSPEDRAPNYRVAVAHSSEWPRQAAALLMISMSDKPITRGAWDI